MHLRYTAKEGGDDYKLTVKTETLGLLAEVVNLPVIRLLSIKNLFSSEWFKLQMASNNQMPSLKLDLTADKFPYLLRNKTLKESKAEVLFIPSDLSKAGTLGTFSVSRLGFDGLQVIENPATVAHPKAANVYMAELTSLKDLEICKGSPFELSLRFGSTEISQAVSVVADIGILLHCTVKLEELPE